MGKIPAYVSVYNTIKSQIIAGEYGVGERIPTEPELEKLFGVSRTTVRKAVELLSQEGFVRAKQGRGTSVLDYKTLQDISGGAVSTLFDSLTKSGRKVYPKTTYIDTIEANPSIAKELEIAEGDRVARIQRLQTADDVPFSILKDYIPYQLVPGIEAYDQPIYSLFAFLEEQYGLSIVSTHAWITAKNADFTEAEMLQVPVRTALVYFRRICFDREGKVICSVRSSTVGDKYEIEVKEKLDA